MTRDLALSGIEYRFKRAHSFGISVAEFSLAAGNISFLHGRSGSGKTTLLNLLSGVLQSNIDGLIREQCPKVGYVMHESTLLPWKTVNQNLRIEATLREEEPPVTLFEGYCRQFEIDKDALSNKAARLSLGMRQRIEIAKALSFKPDLLLLDEAFSGIDLKRRKKVSDEVCAWALRTGAKIIATAHQLPDLLRFANVVHVLDAGKLVKTTTISTPIAERKKMSNEDLVHLSDLQGTLHTV